MSKTDKADEGLPDEDKYLVPGLMRGLQVLKAFTPEITAMSLSDIARRLNMSRSAAFRSVYTLAHLGYLLHDPRTKLYSLGPSVLRLGYGYLATRELVEIALPELERLRDATDWSAHLGVRDGRFVLYMLRVPSRMGLASIVHVGSRLPAAATTMGRVLLADLSEETVLAIYREETYPPAPRYAPRNLAELLEQRRRDKGATTVTQIGSFETGIASIAAPVRDMSGSVVAAINLTRPVMSEMTNIDASIRRELIKSAMAISRMLGFVSESAMGAS